MLTVFVMSPILSVTLSPSLDALIPNSFNRSNSPTEASATASANCMIDFEVPPEMSAKAINCFSVGLMPCATKRLNEPTTSCNENGVLFAKSCKILNAPSAFSIDPVKVTSEAFRLWNCLLTSTKSRINTPAKTAPNPAATLATLTNAVFAELRLDCKLRNARCVSSLAVNRVSSLVVAILFHRLFLSIGLNLNINRPLHKLINRHFRFQLLNRLA